MSPFIGLLKGIVSHREISGFVPYVFLAGVRFSRVFPPINQKAVLIKLKK
jgi:hypothetical protein